MHGPTTSESNSASNASSLPSPCDIKSHPCFDQINMSSNVGLSTPRGSGTSGYVQKNRSLLKPREKAAPYPQDWEKAKHRPRQPDPEILEHERKREIEVKVLELRDKLEDEGYVWLLPMPHVP